MIERRYVRAAELRATAGRTLRGVVVRYGEIATDRPERFAPFAFDPLPAAVPVNVQHREAMIVTRDVDLHDGPEALRMAARVPTGNQGDAVLGMVESGMLTGLSSEFVPLVDPRIGGVRVVQRALLAGVGVVDSPSYKGSTVEVRQAGRGLTGTFHYGRARVTRDRGKRRKQRVSPGAFSWQLERFAELTEQAGDTIGGLIAEAVKEAADAREVALVAAGDGTRPLASLRAGTLFLRDTPVGLEFTAPSLPDTTYARDLRAGMEARAGDYGVDVLFRIPPADVVPDSTRIETEPDTGVEIEVVDAAVLTAISITPRAPRGNRGRVDFTEPGAEQRQRRTRLWL